jgi:hypothetical protein
MRIELKPYQAEFLPATDDFCAMISSVGTGKTLMLLLKAWQYAEKNPDSLILIVRKEFTDLRDSTIKDFQTYFGVTVDGNKEYKFPSQNRSVIMFRHGDELAVLKNMNLSFVGIEQAEEFESDETFVFLMDRLRRNNAPYRQMCVIANANGHNWLWRIFINSATDVNVIDERTGQIVRRRVVEQEVGGKIVKVRYLCVEANTFANEVNLVPDFLARLMGQKDDAPNHFMQYVMNCHEEVDADDLLFRHKDVYDAPSVVIPYQNRVIKRVMGLDVARFGNDETIFTVIEQKDLYRWEQIFMEVKKKVDTTWTSGYAMELERKFNLDLTVVDDIGVGGGVTDNLKNNNGRILGFIANATASASKQRDYEDCNTEGFCMMADLILKGWLKLLPDHIQSEQIMQTRFKYKGAKKHILTKEEMRVKYKELKSPDRAKALMMAIWGTDKRPMELSEQSINLPKYGITDSDSGRTGMDQYENQSRYADLPAYGRTE